MMCNNLFSTCSRFKILFHVDRNNDAVENDTLSIHSFASFSYKYSKHIYTAISTRNLLKKVKFIYLLYQHIVLPRKPDPL